MISIIIPTYNEIEHIDSFQRALDAFHGRAEIVFSDGGSTDGTFEAIRYPKIQKAKGRGAQLALGVKETTGDVLWFLHADTHFPLQALDAVETCTSPWGCFKLAFSSNDPMMKIVAFNSNNRVRFRRIVFGDQGLFLDRALYEKIDGFKSIPLMEDYDISMRLKTAGYTPKLLPLQLTTDARRFEKNGVWRTIFHMQRLQRAFRRGADPSLLAKRY
ncbi:MAG: TIGR04283 family arsenosugar biosynthesis glycosyltransferase [Peptoniphilus sp.]|nr:TIGR04283 family arsenosugar biosynthesis glycosyltransferase [Peptoniphilus sp.]MDY3118460.1 TIGR04283 family arsenosugar biosynthesis glycosyltransferase [Peptoniphilus sp.]